MSSIRRLSAVIIFIALGIALSPLNIPMGPTKAYPMQHMVNVLTGILFGPFYAAFVATAIGTIRIALGVGTVFAYPGGIPGGIVVGFFYWYVKRTDYMAFTEPLGTSLGAVFSAIVVVQFLPRAMPPILGVESQILLWVVYWLFSGIPGSVLGFLLLKVLRRTGVVKKIFLQGSPE